MAVSSTTDALTLPAPHMIYVTEEPSHLYDYTQQEHAREHDANDFRFHGDCNCDMRYLILSQLLRQTMALEDTKGQIRMARRLFRLNSDDFDVSQ